MTATRVSWWPEVYVAVGLTPRVAVAVKSVGWCLWHYSREAGLAVIQVGPVVVEVAD